MGAEEIFDFDGLVDPETGDLSQDVKDRAMNLIVGIAELCQKEQPAIVLFVLEAAMTEQISMHAPPLAEMFMTYMAQYKERATILLSMVELVKQSGEDVLTAGGTVEDVIGVLRTGFMQEPKPRE